MVIKVTFTQFRDKLAFYLKEMIKEKKVAIYDGRSKNLIVTLMKSPNKLKI